MLRSRKKKIPKMTCQFGSWKQVFTVPSPFPLPVASFCSGILNMAAGVSSGTLSKLSIPAGSRVCCTTCNGEKIEGEVLAFDIDQKMLILSILLLRKNINY